MTGATGLEPATSAVTGQRSNQLSYAPRLRGEMAPALRAHASQYAKASRSRLPRSRIACPPGSGELLLGAIRSGADRLPVG